MKQDIKKEKVLLFKDIGGTENKTVSPDNSVAEWRGGVNKERRWGGGRV